MNHFHDFMKDKAIFTDEELSKIGTLETQAQMVPESFESFAKELCKIICPAAFHRPVFSNYKKYDVPPLTTTEYMKRGLEVFRVVFSYYAAKHRKYPAWYLDSGVTTTTNYMGKETAEKISNEFKNYPLAVHKLDGQNITKDSTNPFVLECAYKILEDVTCVIGDTPEIKTKFFNNTFMQRVHNKPDGNASGTLVDVEGEDIQKQIHTDIFFPAIKYWYFPEEVKLEHGPLCYVPDSCGLDTRVLAFWYEESIRATTGEFPEWKTVGHTEGSLRASKHEIEMMGLKCEPMLVPTDTLVIGNVHGFHHRGFATVETVRPAIHGSIRIDKPFGV